MIYITLKRVVKHTISYNVQPNDQISDFSLYGSLFKISGLIFKYLLLN